MFKLSNYTQHSRRYRYFSFRKIVIFWKRTAYTCYNGAVSILVAILKLQRSPSSNMSGVLGQAVRPLPTFDALSSHGR